MSKYEDVCPDTIARLTTQAKARYASPKEADKAVKSALHQITGAFMTPAEVKKAQKLLRVAREDETALRETLRLHASTRERLDHIDDFYDQLFAHVPAGRILDLACGLNPIYLGSRGMWVQGLDISGACVSLINGWADAMGWRISAACQDLLCGPTMEPCDTALCMKLLPVMEAQQKGSAMALLGRIPAGSIVVSFPTRSLGGRNVGMERHYAQWFERLMDGSDLRIERSVVIHGELCYMIKKN